MPAVRAAEPLPADAIQRAIDKAGGWLVKQQRPDGSWLAMRSADRSVGATGLVLLTGPGLRSSRAAGWRRSWTCP
jgi:hypothetical protein